VATFGLLGVVTVSILYSKRKIAIARILGYGKLKRTFALSELMSHNEISQSLAKADLFLHIMRMERGYLDKLSGQLIVDVVLR